VITVPAVQRNEHYFNFFLLINYIHHRQYRKDTAEGRHHHR